MAGISFTLGQNMTRPGVYNRYEQRADTLFAGASDGIAACALNSDWGELGKVREITDMRQAQEAFGNGTEVIRQLLAGGAQVVYAVRAGSGGKLASGTLKGAGGASAISISARCPGTRALKYALADGGEGVRTFSVLEDGMLLERFSFAAGGDEAAALIKAAAGSLYLKLEAVPEYSEGGALMIATETALSGGQQPTATAADYASALNLLTGYAWNCVCADSDSDDVRQALCAYVKSASEDGHMGFAVIGEGVAVALDERIAHARAMNDRRVVYVGGGWYEGADALVDGWRAAARVAGMIACVPCNRSLTHRLIEGGTRCAEALTNARYVACTQAGMLTFSPTPAGLVWIENAITTLNSPAADDDRGWMKIKRARIRFELMDRACATISPMVGNVSNDDDGRAAVVQALQGLLRNMTSEGKLLGDARVSVDASTPPGGDSAAFIIEANDVDALEKVYFTYRFSFSQA